MKRRAFLSDLGVGFTGLALGSMLYRDGIARAATASHLPDGKPHFAPKAKSVIWLFMIGGVSQMDTFDPKPELNKYAGKTFDETPHGGALDNPLTKKNLREVIAGLHKPHSRIYPMQTGYRKRGQSGIEVSDWFPHTGECIDDIAVVRSLWTTDNNHGAQMQFHTGRHVLEGQFPTIGAWVHYGLGSLNENLPQFVVLGDPIDSCCGGLGAHGASYLGPEHGGVQLAVDAENPLPFAKPAANVTPEQQRRELELLREFNGLAAAEYPDDLALRARIKSYELAFRMQTAVPEVMTFREESEATRKLYGLDHEVTKPFGETCLAARRMVERGTRFIQVFHGSNGGAGKWDGHSKLKKTHSELCAQVDQPIAGLLRDLKQRGLLKDTIVAFVTEFGRTPGAQGLDGRDHHPYGFTVWLAGGGIKGGVVHGATDEIGFHAVENRHYVTDVHATILHQMGLDPRKLEVPGRKRLDIDFGTPIREILA
ncbi:MAG: DUF1501 domain-containing protein [Bryobacterales bacterium]|nr:DUF1501 domain-containing protein [Bryobacterales bacterium]